jgi:hypothetical protein
MHKDTHWIGLRKRWVNWLLAAVLGLCTFACTINPIDEAPLTDHDASGSGATQGEQADTQVDEAADVAETQGDSANIGQGDALHDSATPDDSGAAMGDSLDGEATGGPPQPPPSLVACLPPEEQVTLCSEGPIFNYRNIALNRWAPLEPHGVELFAVLSSSSQPEGYGEDTSGVLGDCLCRPTSLPVLPSGIVWYQFDGDENRVVDMEYCPFPTDRYTIMLEETSDLDDYNREELKGHVGSVVQRRTGVQPEWVLSWPQAGWNYAILLERQASYGVTTGTESPPHARNLLARWTGPDPNRFSWQFQGVKHWQDISFPVGPCAFPAERFLNTGCVEGQPLDFDRVNLGNTFSIAPGDPSDPSKGKVHSDPTKPTVHTFYGIMRRAGLTFIRLGGSGQGYVAIEARGTSPGVYEAEGFHSNPAAMVYMSHVGSNTSFGCGMFCTTNDARPGKARVTLERVDDERVTGVAEAWIFNDKLGGPPRFRIEFDLGFQACRAVQDGASEPAP